MNVGVVNHPHPAQKVDYACKNGVIRIVTADVLYVVTSWVLIQGFHLTGLLYTRKILVDCQTRWEKFFSQLVNSHPLIKTH